MGSPAGDSAPSGLADALFSSVEQRVLALLFGQPDRRFQSSELVRLARSGNGATQRVLARLVGAGLVMITQVGNQKHYQANRESPVFAELHGLIVKTVGLVEPLRRALAPLADRIDLAFAFGSIASGRDRAGSDVDLFIVSETLSHFDVFEACTELERELARPVNPTIYTTEEWRTRRATEGSFAARVAARPRLFVIGSDDGQS
jgi:predicted nucleotidyltransferase